MVEIGDNQEKILKIVCTNGNLRGLIFKLKVATINVGRSPSNDIVVADATCSRKQAFFMVSDKDIHLFNLNEDNPVLVNGRKAVGKIEVQGGDNIHFGQTIWLAYRDEVVSPLTPGPMGTVEMDETVRKCLYDSVTQSKV